MSKTNKQHARKERRIREYLWGIKSKTPCQDCGKMYHPVAMQFDHVRGLKKFNLSKPIKTWTSVFEEISKCDIVCSNCHHVRTFTRSTQAKVAIVSKDPQLTFTF